MILGRCPLSIFWSRGTPPREFGNEIYYTNALMLLVRRSCDVNFVARFWREKRFVRVTPSPKSTQQCLTPAFPGFPGKVAARWSSRVPLIPDSGVLRDPICTTHGPKLNCVRQVDFWWKGRTAPCGSRYRRMIRNLYGNRSDGPLGYELSRLYSG